MTATRNYVYIVQLREFVRSGEQTYKIGKSVNPRSRLNGYPKGTHFIMYNEVSNMDKMETKLKKEFKKKFEQMTEYGLEYFNGPIVEMKKIYLSFILDDLINFGVDLDIIYDLTENNPNIYHQNSFIKFMDTHLEKTDDIKDYMSFQVLYSNFKKSIFYEELEIASKKKYTKKYCLQKFKDTDYYINFHVNHNKKNRKIQTRHPICKNSNILSGYIFREFTN